jgi:putative hydrolase of HD superfamily
VEALAELILPLLEPVARLKRLPRTGWLLAGVSQPESVAEHTCATALLAYFLAELINQAPDAHGLADPLDVGRVAAIALVHDLAESDLSDLPRQATRLLGEPVKHAAEARALGELFSALPTGERMLALWHEYAEAATPEARLVRDADKLEMVYQAWSYEQAGQQRLGEFWEGHRWHYRAVEQLFETLLRRRQSRA